jgi:hypothetical protein
VILIEVVVFGEVSCDFSEVKVDVEGARGLDEDE